MGDEYDAFNFDFNELLTPWSNPSTYVDGTTNISIQLYNQNGNNITVKAFTTAASAVALPPSKPQMLEIEWYNNHPKITWETNIETDIQSYRIWKHAEGSSMIAATITHNPNNSTHSWVDYDVDMPDKFDPQYTYSYKVKAIDNTNKESLYSNLVSIVGTGGLWKEGNKDNRNNDLVIKEYSLSQNYPNPFNPTTQISYQIKESGFVQLMIYNTLGQKVATLVNEVKSEGKYTINYNAKNLPSGVYIYTLRVNDFVQSQKMALLK